VIALFNSPCERIGKRETRPRGQIVSARLAGASVTKIATLFVLGKSRATVSKVMLEYTNHGKRTSAKRNSGRKSTLQKEVVVLLQHR
jgi:transposase